MRSDDTEKLPPLINNIVAEIINTVIIADSRGYQAYFPAVSNPFIYFGFQRFKRALPVGEIDKTCCTEPAPPRAAAGQFDKMHIGKLRLRRLV